MNHKKYNPWLRYLGLTAQLLVLLGIGLYAGLQLDRKFNVYPLLTIALPLLVLAVTLYKLVKETGKKDET